MNHEYASIYKMLNDHAHNSLSALQSRHMELGEQGIEIVYYKDTPLDNVEHYFGMTIELVMRCTEKLHDVFNSPVQAEVANLREQVDVLREHAGSE